MMVFIMLVSSNAFILYADIQFSLLMVLMLIRKYQSFVCGCTHIYMMVHLLLIKPITVL